MEFDKSKVYTALNADELKIGSKVITADSITVLKDYVCDHRNISELITIRDESSTYRFIARGFAANAFCYLVSEPEEKKLKWTDLKIGDIVTRDKVTYFLVTGLDKSQGAVLVNDFWLDNSDLESWEKVDLEEKEE